MRRLRSWFVPVALVLSAWAAYAGHLDGPVIVGVEAHVSPLAELTLDWSDARAVNLALHALVVLLVLVVLRRALGAPRMPNLLRGGADHLAAATALLFAVHPLASDCVFDAQQRGVLLGAIGLLATCYAALRVFAGGGRGWLAAALVAVVLGLLSHPFVIAAPALLFLFSRAFEFGSFAATWRAHRALWIGLGAALLVPVGLCFALEPSGAAGGFEPAYLLAQGRLAPDYFVRMLWPRHLVLDHGPFVPGLVHFSVSMIALVGALAFAAVGTWTHPRSAWAVTWCLGLLAPTSSLVANLAEVGAERRAYPVLVVFLALLLALPLFLISRQRRAAREAGRRAWVVGVLFVALGSLAWTRARFEPWRSAQAFWTRAVIEAPRNPRAHERHADQLRLAGRADAALRAYQRSLALDPRNGVAHASLGTMLVAAERLPEAAVHLAAAAARAPADFERQAALGACLISTGRAAEAVASLERAHGLRPADAAVRGQLGIALSGAGQHTAAIGHLRAAIEANADSAAVSTALASSMDANGDRAGAVVVLERAVRRWPREANARALLGRLRSGGAR